MEDDYGVEAHPDTQKETKQADGPQQPASKTEESKQAVKEAKQIQEQVPSDDEEDEEDIWAKPVRHQANEGDIAEQEAAQAKLLAESESFVPSDTLFVFMGTEFLHLDFQRDTWAIEDVQQADGSSVFYVPENSSMVKIDANKHNCEHSNVFVTGGVAPTGQLLDQALGLSFERGDGSSQQGAYQLQLTCSDPRLILPLQRMMHEACLVQDAQGHAVLLVMGGKIGKHLSTCAYTSGVIAFDMTLVFQPWLESKLEAAAQAMSWQTRASMQCKRANFCHMVLDNLVYVFGGVSGTVDEKKNAHVPKIAELNCERYNPKSDLWESFEIPNIPSLGAFAWTGLGEGSSKMIILGGSDGDLIQEQQWTIDFAEQNAAPSDFQFEQTIAMNKLVYRKSINTLYSIGGYGSSGQSFKLQLDAGQEWKELERSHLALLTSSMARSTSQELELVNFPFVFFA